MSLDSDAGRAARRQRSSFRLWPLGDLLPNYVFVLGLTYLVNLAAVFAATSQLGWNPYLAQLIGIALYTFCSFLGCRRFLFAPRASSRCSSAPP